MVNVKNLFGMAVMATALVGCASNDEPVNPNPEQNGVAYAAFKINLPQVSGTRADAGVGSYEDGTASEYNVQNATFLVFKQVGTDEANYTFVESAKLNMEGTWNSETTEGLTVSKKLVTKLNSISKGGKYSVLVVLNTPSDFVAPSVGQTYGDWNNKVLTPSDVTVWATANNFYMANATLANGSATTTLTNIADNNIYNTKEAAEAGTSSAEVFVERGVAKVTVSQPTANMEVKKDGTANGDHVNFNNWALDVTNKKTYAVHNVTGLTVSWADIWTSERMTGAQSRVFWGIDPNYSDNTLKDVTDNNAKLNENFNYVGNDGVTNAFGETPAYCFENTFNLENMYQGQTTRVVFKATYTPSTGHADDATGTFYHLGTASTNLTSVELLKAIEDAAKAELGTSFKSVVLGDIQAKGGVHFVECANIKVDNSGSEETLDASATYGSKTGAQIVEAINTRLGLKTADRDEDKVGISTYLNGVTYYIARIRHFNNTYCPWTSGQGYNTNEGFLGRYGMLRNNWYSLDINSVSGPGYPGVPPVDPDQPDDENENYLSVSVKILDWAKRTQSVDL